jgi:hypothetical protein
VSRRPTRDERSRLARAEWLQERATAETVACPTCEAPPGETCRNVHTGSPLAGLPAHFTRLQCYAAAPRVSSAAA